MPKKELQKKLDLGDKYLTDMDYNEAILAYQEAININPKSEQAYLGLGRTYEYMADEALEEGNREDALEYINKAVKELKNGYSNTESEEIKDELNRMKEKKEEIEEDAGEDTNDKDKEKGRKEEASETVADNTDLYTKEAYEAYLNLLSADSTFNLYDNNGKQEPSVSFCDVYGDDTPEMICANEYINSYNVLESRTLYIYTLENGQLKELTGGHKSMLVTAGIEVICVFKHPNSKQLYRISEHGDDSWMVEYFQYDEMPGALQDKLILADYAFPDDSRNHEYVDTYYQNGVTISKSQYEAEEAKLLTDGEILYYTYEGYLNMFSGSVKNYSMTYTEAISYLNSWITQH